MLWPEVTRVHFLKAVAFQRDQKDDWISRSRVGRARSQRQKESLEFWFLHFPDE